MQHGLFVRCGFSLTPSLSLSSFLPRSPPFLFELAYFLINMAISYAVYVKSICEPFILKVSHMRANEAIMSSDLSYALYVCVRGELYTTNRETRGCSSTFKRSRKRARVNDSRVSKRFTRKGSISFLKPVVMTFIPYAYSPSHKKEKQKTRSHSDNFKGTFIKRQNVKLKMQNMYECKIRADCLKDFTDIYRSG